MNGSKLKITHKRAVVSGNVVEIYEYENPVIKGYASKAQGRANQNFTDAKTKAENRKKVTNRARLKVKRYANANTDMRKFVTLTFKENVTDINVASEWFNLFLTKLRKEYPTLKFIKVVEFQKRGAIHYHMLCNLPYITHEEFRSYWGFGFFRINMVDKIDNVGAYITKYMCKEMDERLKGQRAYSMSQNLEAPVLFEDEDSVEYMLANNADKVLRVYEKSFESEYYGTITYKQIVLTGKAITDKVDSQFYRIAKKHGIWLEPYYDEDCPF